MALFARKPPSAATHTLLQLSYAVAFFTFVVLWLARKTLVRWRKRGVPCVPRAPARCAKLALVARPGLSC
jgi:hypothetical protein